MNRGVEIRNPREGNNQFPKAHRYSPYSLIVTQSGTQTVSAGKHGLKIWNFFHDIK